MKKLTTLFMAIAFMASAMISQAVDLDGATPGVWTMDLDAAKVLAAEKKLPILLDFSGSDWCGWCQLMERNVFDQPAWAEYAVSNLVMVLIDFPSDESLVPEKYVARNEALQMEYGVEGFPTFVVLDDDGETELGRLGSGEDKTAASFQKELEGLFRNRAATMEKYAASLAPEDRATFKALVTKLAEQELAVVQAEEAMIAAELKIEELTETIALTEEEMQEFRVSQLPAAEQKVFTDLKDRFADTRMELISWLATDPEQTEENSEKFQTMQTELQECLLKLEAY